MFLSELYFECKDRKAWPYEGGMIQQTNYVFELFHFFDGIVGKHWESENQKREYEYKKTMDKMKNESQGVKKPNK